MYQLSYPIYEFYENLDQGIQINFKNLFGWLSLKSYEICRLRQYNYQKYWVCYRLH